MLDDPAYSRLCACRRALKDLPPGTSAPIRELFRLICLIRQGEVEANMVAHQLLQPRAGELGQHNLISLLSRLLQRRHAQVMWLASLRDRCSSPLTSTAAVLLEEHHDRLEGLLSTVHVMESRGELRTWSDDSGEPSAG